MNRAAHTPGPWRYFKEGNGTRFHVTARPSTKPGNQWDDFATVNIRNEADARLIAIAPELYEALRALVAAVEDNDADSLRELIVAHDLLDKVSA